MLIVADSSALVALATADALGVLDQLFSEIRVPPAVFRECTIPGKPEGERLEGYLQGKVIPVDLGEFVIGVSGLGQGELEAMALYKRLHADRLLIDDGRARKVASLNGIEVIGSLGALLQAKEAGLIPAVRPLLNAMQAAGIRHSEQLCVEALRLAGE